MSAFCVLLTACADQRGAEPSHQDGGITVERVGGPGMAAIELGLPMRVARSGHGSYYIGTRLDDALIVEVDSASGEVIQTIGATGEGPGEYRSVNLLLRRGDSLMAQHPVSGRVNVYGSDGTFSHWFDADVPIQMGDVLVLRGDTMVFAEPLMLPDVIGLPLHLLAPGGARVRSFGAEDRSVDPDFIMPQLRLLAPESDSSFWVARRDRYRIELWNTAGELERLIEPDRPWFPPMTAYAVDPTSARPTTQMTGISRDAHGHLVVVLVRSPEDWKPTKSGTTGPGDPLSSMAPYEVVLEVLDGETGSLLASHVPKGIITFGRFLDDGLLQGYGDAGDGVPSLILWRIRHGD